VSVTVTGTGKADASFEAPAVSFNAANIAINVVIADLTGTQSASISGLDVKAASVII